jgi:hypothetical protein
VGDLREALGDAGRGAGGEGDALDLADDVIALVAGAGAPLVNGASPANKINGRPLG